MKKYSAKLETILSIGLTDVDMFSKDLAYHFEQGSLRNTFLKKLVDFKIHDRFYFIDIISNYLDIASLKECTIFKPICLQKTPN